MNPSLILLLAFVTTVAATETYVCVKDHYCRRNQFEGEHMHCKFNAEQGFKLCTLLEPATCVDDSDCAYDSNLECRGYEEGKPGGCRDKFWRQKFCRQ
ncbi:unnamed protein product, partial [Mesorhabditis spiculigera]